MSCQETPCAITVTQRVKYTKWEENVTFPDERMSYLLTRDMFELACFNKRVLRFLACFVLNVCVCVCEGCVCAGRR